MNEMLFFFLFYNKPYNAVLDLDFFFPKQEKQDERLEDKMESDRRLFLRGTGTRLDGSVGFPGTWLWIAGISLSEIRLCRKMLAVIQGNWCLRRRHINFEMWFLHHETVSKNSIGYLINPDVSV